MGSNSYICRSYRGKTGGGLFALPSPTPHQSWIGLRGWDIWMNRFKTENLWQKSFLKIVVIEWTFENLWKIISADVKANKNNKKIKDLALSYKILKDVKIWNTSLKYLQNLKYNMKGASIFHLILVGILSVLILSVKSMGAGGFLLNWQNPLSMESYLWTVPKWAIPKNTNKHECVRWVYGTSRGIKEIQSGGVLLGQKQGDLGFRP